MEEEYKKLDKSTLNLQIVSMRHNVMRSKVQTLNKLVRIVKALKNKKAEDEQKSKNLRKAEIFLKEIFIIKGLKKDEISKFCLENFRNPNEILADTNVDLKTKALARLSLHSSISPVITKFQMKFPDWQLAVPKVLHEKKKSNSRVSTRMSEEYLQENTANSPIFQSDEKIGIKGNSFTVSINPAKKILENKEPEVKIPKSRPLHNKNDETSVNQEHSEPKPKINTPEKEPEKTYTRTQNGEDGEMNEKEKHKKYVDTFFLVNDNLNYMSYAEVEDNDDNERTFSYDLHTKRKINNIGRNKFVKQARDFPKKGTVSDRRYNKDEKNGKNIKLHPSWEAKKKLSSIPTFEGKKLIFD